MSLHTKVSSDWKTVNAVYVNVSGTWKQCKQVYVNVSGTWKPLLLTTKSVTVNGPTSVNASVTLSNVKNGSTVTYQGKILNDDYEYAASGFTCSVTNASISSFYHAAGTWEASKSFSGSFTANSTSVVVKCTQKNKTAYMESFTITYTQEYYT